MKYCSYCRREVRPIDSRDTTGFVMKILRFLVVLMLSGLTAGLFLIMYLPARAYSKHCNMVCPICNAKL
jgi:hypothetical protein